MIVLSLFDGIATGRLALERLGVLVDGYYASEIDPGCLKIAQMRYPDIVQLGCVKCVRAADLPRIALLLAGSPCQGFSRAGRGLGFDDKRSVLFFEFVRLLRELEPVYFLLENTRMPLASQDVVSTHLGVEPLRINSSLVSAQNRDRLYWTNIPGVTIPADRCIMLRDIIGAYDCISVYPRGTNSGGLKFYNGKCPTITAGSWQTNFHVVRFGVKEAFTVEECERIQTLPVGYTEALCNTRRYKVIGNSWTSAIIEHILSALSRESI